MVEPAVQQIAGREGHRANAEVERSRRRLDYLMTIEAGAALGKDVADRLVGSAAEAGAGAGDLDGGLDPGDVAGPRPRAGAQFGGRLRPAGAIERAQIADHLRRRAVAQGADGAADLVEGEAVAHAAVGLHVDRLEAGAVGRRNVAVGALKRVAEAVAAVQPPSHLGCAAARIEMERGREFEVAHLARMSVEPDPLQLRPLAVPADQNQRLELGMAVGEVRGAGEPGIGQARAQIAMAVGAETLRGRRDSLRPLMLGVAIDATARFVSEPPPDRHLEATEAAQI